MSIQSDWNTAAGSNAYRVIRATLAASIDISDYNVINFFWYGGNVGGFVLYFNCPTTGHRYYKSFNDPAVGWNHIQMHMDSFSTQGTPDWADVTAFWIEHNTVEAGYRYLDRFWASRMGYDVARWA